MSRCRCSDISNTENKVRQLERAQGKLPRYYVKKGVVEDGLQQCSSRVNQAIVSNLISSYHMTMITLCNGMDDSANGISGKMNSRLSELRSSLSSMRSEDHDYHEEERRRQEEEEAAARAAAAKNSIK